MAEVKKIVFLGASTAFYEVSEIIHVINLKEKSYEIIAILDDNFEMHGKLMRGVKVEGPLSLASNYTNAYFVLGIGSMKTRLIRQEILNKINIEESRFVSIIHPSAVIDRSAKIKNGCIIHPGVCIGNDASIDSFAIIAVNTAIGPYAYIGKFAMITSLVAILSSVKIGKSVFVGSCSCITENVEIGNGSMIGAGTVVSRNIEKGSFFLGNPGRLINRIELPIDHQ
jgi:sugar O-acyltransferase (sialic acid O-acetyltransferase NeuD family)